MKIEENGDIINDKINFNINISLFLTLLAVLVGNMKCIQCSDRLPEPAKWAHLAQFRLPALTQLSSIKLVGHLVTASFATCQVCYVRVCYMFTTYMPNSLLSSSYHSIILHSIIFQNQHLDLKKSALLKLKWVPCFSILSWLSSGPSIAHNGTVALTRERKHKTSKEQSKLLILQYFLYFIKLYISESICTLKRFLLRVT